MGGANVGRVSGSSQSSRRTRSWSVASRRTCCRCARSTTWAWCRGVPWPAAGSRGPSARARRTRAGVRPWCRHHYDMNLPGQPAEGRGGHRPEQAGRRVRAEPDRVGARVRPGAPRHHVADHRPAHHGAPGVPTAGARPASLAATCWIASTRSCRPASISTPPTSAGCRPPSPSPRSAAAPAESSSGRPGERRRRLDPLRPPGLLPGHDLVLRHGIRRLVVGGLQDVELAAPLRHDVRREVLRRRGQRRGRRILVAHVQRRGQVTGVSSVATPRGSGPAPRTAPPRSGSCEVWSKTSDAT